MKHAPPLTEDKIKELIMETLIAQGLVPIPKRKKGITDEHTTS
jgi:hypothetical protein